MIFLKLGGSLITDKTESQTVRTEALAQAAAEICQAQRLNPQLRLVIGHGSGSFGHVTAAKYGTRQGVQTAVQWHGFAEVSDVAARLNRIVTGTLLAAGVPAISFQPSASAWCENGRLTHLSLAPIQAALAAGLVPVVYGDVAFDTVRGGSIISTEEVLTYAVAELRPSWFLLAGETAGVYDQQQQIIPLITENNFRDIQAALGGSRGTDVTGGMDSKVRSMLNLVNHYPDMSIRIFSGLAAGEIQQTLLQPHLETGTCIRAAT